MKKFCKIMALVLVVVMAITALTACQGGGEKVDEPVDLTFISMGTSTAIYTYSSTIAQLLLNNGYLPEGSTIDVPTTSPGGLTAQYKIIDGTTDMVIMNGISVIWSMEKPNGVMDLGKVTKGVKSLVNGLDMPHIALIFTEAFVSKTGCSSMEDLVKNKVAANFYIKEKGNLGEEAFNQLIAALGTTEEAMKGWGCTINRTTSANISQALQDGTGDIQIDHLPNGQSAAVSLTNAVACRVVGMAQSTADKLAAKGWTLSTWKAGESKFKGHNSDLITVGAPNCLLVSENMSEELAYQITKCVCENYDALINASAALKVFDPTKAYGILTDILHPGAVKYYKEMGYIK